MRHFGMLVLVCAVVVCIVGCLSAEKQARLDVLVSENEKLAAEVRTLLDKAKDGTATTSDVAVAVAKIHSQMSKNVEEMKTIKEGSTWTAVVAGVIGALGRTVLHAGAAAIPASGPIGALLQGGLTLLLGGSSTAKKVEVKA